MPDDQQKLYEMIRDEMAKQGRDLRDHSDKAEESARVLQKQISAIVVSQEGARIHMDHFHQQLAEIKSTLEPLVTTTAVHTKDIQDNDLDIEKIFVMIGEDRNKMRDISVKNVTESSGSTSFWELPVAKYVAIGGLIILIGLFGLAGYNISLKDLPVT